MTLFPPKIMLLGSGELGKEIGIAAQRLGCNVIACDRYTNAPAMQIADKAEVLDMTDPNNLKDVIRKHKPTVVVPEIEALAVDALIELEKEGVKIIPTARATAITMNRDKIRDLASKELGIKTAQFAYASNPNQLYIEAESLGFPVIIKPVMSSSGKGQTLVHRQEDLPKAWEYAMKGARGSSEKVIIEEFLKFELEITLLTIKQKNGNTLFCKPIGHEQSEGDYQCSWQPATLTDKQLEDAKSMAKIITDNLGGEGLFGVEFFICQGEVIFSELSPRPHDTGLVTIISQNFNEFELHLRAILGLPIPEIINTKPAASRVILAKSNCSKVCYKGVEKALSESNSKLLLFGKPNAKKGRRMGVALAVDELIKDACEKADKLANFIEVMEDK